MADDGNKGRSSPLCKHVWRYYGKNESNRDRKEGQDKLLKWHQLGFWV